MKQFAYSAAALFLTIVSPALGQGALGEANTPAPVAGQTTPWPVSKMIGVVVYTAGGEPVGKITDLIMGEGSCIATAILSVSGNPVGGERYVQVPLGTIRFPRDTKGAIYPEKAVINTTKDAIAKMPAFQY